MISILISIAACERFAVLAAGSNDFFNYRHQADIHTIYTKLIERGYKESNIITLAYDDEAQHQYNPFKGQIFHTVDHKQNVYPGSEKITYKSHDVSSDTFARVLTTELKSTAEDDLFIYFDDHGDCGFLCFPESYMLARDCANALNQMEANGKYKRCLFGIEACFSGSVAESFTNKNMVTITAANALESSFAAVWDESMTNYLSNEFTNIWIDEMDKNPSQTIGEFYETLKENTKNSHACFFGDVKMKELNIEVFFGKPTKQIIYKPTKSNTMPVNPLVATYSCIIKMMKSENPSVRAASRLKMHELESLSKKMEIALDSIISITNTKDVETVKKTIFGKVTNEYQNVLSHFIGKFGKFNQDDKFKFTILCNLVAIHGEDAIISAINQIL